VREATDLDRLGAALRTATDRLLAEMRPDGYWEGELSASALATATALLALDACGRSDDALIERGIAWLAADQNPDGGWGDSPNSPSNLSTTMLALAALTRCRAPEVEAARSRADDYVSARAGRSVDERVAAVSACYGADRTFAAPILVACALAGLVPWDRIPRLPFELAALPRALHRVARLRVVSYALPALIAIGLALHRNHPPGVIVRALRGLTVRPALTTLERIQPESGGFLEAVPLTSFVAMGLASASANGVVAGRCLDFIARTARPDGSWPIDSNLSVWLTTNAVLALDAAGALEKIDAARTRGWLLAQQCRTRHPYTNAAAGGWAWTHLPGGVPDADDTARALLALSKLGERNADGVRWLLRLQNRDGGWPTFCRGWGKLPFDRSAADLTAHAIEALQASGSAGAAVRRGIAYLRRTEAPDGSWRPLWFGSQLAEDGANRVLGTAAVLPALLACGERAAERAIACLVGSQNPDGGWGGAPGVVSSMEETAAAVSALARAPHDGGADRAVERGAAYLAGRIEDGTWTTPAPIGLYFSRLWYFERLYPIIGAVDALGRVVARRTPDDD